IAPAAAAGLSPRRHRRTADCPPRCHGSSAAIIACPFPGKEPDRYASVVTGCRLRRDRPTLAAAGGLAALLCATACAHRVAVNPPPRPAAPPAQERAGPGQLKKEVLAFYYGWYGNPRVSGAWMHWAKVDKAAGQIGTSTHYPQLGPYDSQDPTI